MWYVYPFPHKNSFPPFISSSNFQEEMKSIPIGIVPLGRENRFYQSNLSSTAFKSPVRYVY